MAREVRLEQNRDLCPITDGCQEGLVPVRRTVSAQPLVTEAVPALPARRVAQPARRMWRTLQYKLADAPVERMQEGTQVGSWGGGWTAEPRGGGCAALRRQ